ncbi:unnamed protein product [Lymnaea stagnalis]|uniref:Uncharacterized protein n=1 Tax=Lymnaea stagnalis TaxID=6523 RepID=A0AAV2HRI9_LYMST
MSWTQPSSQHTARGWVHNAENRKNFQRYFALVEAEKIDPDMEPYRSPPPLRPDFRKGHYGFVEGYEHRTVRWYTYRDASGSNKVVQTTVTNPSHPPVTHTEYFKECHGALGSYVSLKSTAV